MASHSSLTLAVIIVSYNTTELTTAAISSVIANVENAPLLKDHTAIWVVDNASKDSSVVDIRQQFSAQMVGKSPVLFLIENTRNAGFAAANNLAIQEALGKNAEHVLLLNSDTIVKDGALETLLRAMINQPRDEKTADLGGTDKVVDRLGILSATLQNTDGSAQPQGGSFPSLLSLAAHWLFLDDIPLLGSFFPATQFTGRSPRRLRASTDQSVVAQDWVGGTAMLIHAQLFAEIGLLDENIFMYGEDMEFCLRAKDHHWDVAICPQAEIIHYGSASSHSSKAILGEINGYLYIWAKHKPIGQLLWAKSILRLGCYLRKTIYKTIKKDPKLAATYHQALVDVLR